MCLNFPIHLIALLYLSLLCHIIHNIPTVITVHATSLPPRQIIHFMISLFSTMLIGRKKWHISQHIPPVSAIVVAYRTWSVQYSCNLPFLKYFLKISSGHKMQFVANTDSMVAKIIPATPNSLHRMIFSMIFAIASPIMINRHSHHKPAPSW